MAHDTELKELIYPCEPASLEKLDNIVRQIFTGFSSGSNPLSGFIHPEPPQNIRWEKLRHLRIVGDDAADCLENFLEAGLSQSFYLNADGSWMLLILPKKSQLKDYISRCGRYLESLEIMNALIRSMDWSEIAGIKSLCLRDNWLDKGIERMDCLTRLERLTIENCPGLTKLDLEKLTNLTFLQLSRCDELTALPGLEKLAQLTSLSLDGCDSLTALPGLGDLTQLTVLSIHFCSMLTNLPGLGDLTQLTKLVVSLCDDLTDLQGLENLTQLTALYIYDCGKLTALPGLEKLAQLTDLMICRCHKLTALPWLRNLTQLTSLDLSNCYCLTELPGLDRLTQLKRLDLSSCASLRELPEGIRHLKQLRSLDLSNLNLLDLPDWLPEIAECFTHGYAVGAVSHKAVVNLRETVVEAIPEMSLFDQPYEVVAKWFEERSLGRTRPLNEIKVVFLGDGEAGKSHTIARLMNDGGDPVDYVDTSTPGIMIKHRTHKVDGREFQVHYWDFGGQEIMHSMHRIFLTGRTMYVVLLNARDDTQGDRAQYWLHNIQSFAPGAPVLLVLNKIDQNPKASVDERTLRARYSGLTQVVKLSALNFTQDEFNSTLTDVLLEEIKNTGFLDAPWPEAWIKVKRRLEDMKTHYILGSKYKSICQECGADDVQTDLLHWFNDLGVSFCFCDKEDYKLKKHVILRPDWITNGLYIILFNECPGARNGQIPHTAIYELLERTSFDPDIKCTLPEASYDRPGDIEYVLGVMRKFQLSLDSGDGNEFIPMLCQQDSTVDLHYYEKDTELLEFRMEFEYLPDNLLHRLMVERYAELDTASAWRKGARFELRELGLSAVVVIDGNTLRFFIRHTDPMHRPNTYLTMLKANVDRIVERMNLTEPECLLIYKHDSKIGTFDYDELRQAREDGETAIYSKVWRKRLSIDEILNQSAPAQMADERKLLDEIRRSCQSIQDEPSYRLIRNDSGRGFANGPGMEDLRNRRVRDDLIRVGFKVADQTQRGSSGAGTSIGELDMLLFNDRNEAWTIIEALRVSDGTKASWNDHLDKLLNKYNSRGLPLLYLLTYVDADPKAFARIWKGYQTHIQKHGPAPYAYCPGSFADLNETGSSQFIRAARCSYSCGGEPVTVYHIFARIPTQNEAL